MQNKEKYKYLHKKYYQENKDKINEKIKCDCGHFTSKNHMKRHMKSQLHIKNV